MDHVFSLSVDGQLGCFHILAILNNTAMIIGVALYLCIGVFGFVGWDCFTILTTKTHNQSEEMLGIVFNGSFKKLSLFPSEIVNAILTGLVLTLPQVKLLAKTCIQAALTRCQAPC